MASDGLGAKLLHGRSLLAALPARLSLMHLSPRERARAVHVVLGKRAAQRGVRVGRAREEEAHDGAEPGVEVDERRAARLAPRRARRRGRLGQRAQLLKQRAKLEFIRRLLLVVKRQDPYMPRHLYRPRDRTRLGGGTAHPTSPAWPRRRRAAARRKCRRRCRRLLSCCRSWAATPTTRSPPLSSASCPVARAAHRRSRRR